MRITNGMLVNNMMNNLNNNLNRMERYQQQGASGRLFEKPSDDPIGMSRSLKLYTDISKVNQYERNLNDANSWMHTTEEALKEVEKILQRTRELSVEAANGTKTETDTKNIAEEIKQLKEQIIKIGNTRHAGRSIFTGFKTDQDLFQANGSYNIDIKKEDVSNYNVGISEDIDINIIGTRVFGSISDVDIIGNNLSGDLVIQVDDSQDIIDMKNRKSDNLHEVKSQLKQALKNAKENGATLEFTIEYKDNTGTQQTVDIKVTNTTTDVEMDTNINNIDNHIKSYKNLPTAKNPAEQIKIDNIKKALGMTKADGTAITGDSDDLWLTIMNNNGKIEVDVEKGFASDGSNKNDESSMMKMFDNILSALDKGDYEEINKQLGTVDKVHKNILSITAEIGAKTNRLDMTEKRLSAEKLNFKTNLSKNEDVDYSELIMKSKLAETVYQVSLAISSKVIQPTLMDFLR